MKCSKCGNEIGRFELSQNCKNCGVNLFYSQQEELLSNDAKMCELEYASARLFVSRLKAAFIGGPLQIVRIVCALFCLGAVFVPFAALSVELPLFSHSISFGGYGLYQSFSDGSLLALFDFAKIGVVSGIARAAIMLLAPLVLLVLLDVAIVSSEILSFTDIRRSAKAICVFSAIGAFVSVAAYALGRYFVSSASVLKSITVNIGFGAWVTLAAYIIMFVINLLIIKKNITPAYKEVDLERVRIRKKVKNGEISLADLPLPVLESDEERAKRIKDEEAEKDLEKAVASNVK